MDVHKQGEIDVGSREVVSFRLLGPLEVISDGRPFALGGLRQSKLLVVLLLHVDVPVPYHRIAEALWDTVPKSVRQQIHNAVGSLRRTLSGASGVELVTSEAGYRIRVPKQLVDVHEFQLRVRESEEKESQGQLEEAALLLSSGLGLWRGPALAGLDGRYMQSLAAQLDEQRLMATERLISLQLRLGSASSLVSDLIGLVAEHPLRESLRGSLMLALHQDGRQADALVVYEEGRRLLAEELGLDPGVRLRELHARILQGDDDTESVVTRAVDDGPGEEAQPGRFLPRDTSEFTGRTAEVIQLLATARESLSSALVISAIDGMGGVGKTTLAVHLAHQLSEDYPDGQYFLDLHGFSVGAEPVKPEQALEELLASIGVPVELIPSSIEARSALWRSRLAGKRALVLLDNAKDEAQVRPLLPGSAGSLILVTSRRRLTALEGTFPLSLNVLPSADAVDLFVQIAGADRAPAAAEDVSMAVGLCGFLPLAIRIAAARFRDRESWTLVDLLQQLRTHKRRTRFLAAGDRNVMSVLRLSYQYLSSDQRLLFRFLCLHPGSDFDAPAAAALSGLRLDIADQCLEALFECSLLIQRVAGRYEFHDLLRDCSRELHYEQDSEDDRRQATHRILDYYLHIAQLWCRPMAMVPFRFDADIQYVPACDEAPPSPSERASLLKANYHGFVAASRFAIDHGWSEHAWQLPCTLMPFLSQLNYGSSSFDLFTGALAAARSVKDRHGEVASLEAMAIISRDRGSGRDARELFQQAIALSIEEGNLSWQAHLSVEIGVSELNDGHIQLAYESFTRGYAMAQKLDDRRLSAALANNIGVVCRDMGKLDEALRYFERASVRDYEVVSRRSEISTMINFGLVYHLQGRFDEAIAAFDRVLDFSIEATSRTGEAAVLCCLSAAHRSRGELRAAVEHGRSALTLARRLGLAEIECVALNALGEAFVSLMEFATAEAVYREAEHAAKARRLRVQGARASEGFAHVNWARGHLSEAAAHWQQALESYPDELAAAEYARGHLAGLADPRTSCPRCAVQSAPRIPSSRASSRTPSSTSTTARKVV